MAVMWKPSATALCLLCFLMILTNAFVNSVRVQSKRVKGVKGKPKIKKTVDRYILFILNPSLLYPKWIFG